MSGSIGANRIPSSAVKKTVDSFIEKVLKKYPTFKSAKITGSYNVIPKDENGEVVGGQEKPEGHGDIDLVVELEGSREDMKKIKADFAAYLNSLSDTITVPFRAGRHTGKKTAGTGDIVITQYPIEGFPDLTVQIDNMIVSTEEESNYRTSFLDIPGPKQALLIGLAKTMCIEEDPFEIFKRLGIKEVPQLKENQEYEFVLSSKGLTLRIVTLENFREVERRDIWMSYKWPDVETLFKDYNINGSFEQLLKQLIDKQWRSQRSKNRIKGTFKSMLVIGAGETGTPKGADKEAALNKVNSLLENGNETKTVAIYAGGFKPPHKVHYENAKILGNQADKLVIFIGPLVREGVPITAQQSKAIWEIYAKYLATPVEVYISEKTPILDTYLWIDENQPKVDKIITGTTADEMKKFSGIIKNKDKYPKVELMELPIIATKEDDKFSASVIRSSEEYMLSGKWIPSVVSQQDKQAIIDIVTPKSIEDRMSDSIEEVFNNFFPSKKHDLYLDEGKFAYPKPLSSYFQKALHEISFSKDNAVKINGGTMSGTFAVGDSKYRYSITPFAKSPYGDEGTFYNIAFHPIKSKVSTPQGGKENYVKILSTMYKIILDFIEQHQPDYLGIGSLDNEEGRNYQTVYASLTDNKANRIPGYFRKDVSMPFKSPEGPGKMVVMKKKQQVHPLEENSTGTPIAASSAIPSADRAVLNRLYDDLKIYIPKEEFEIVFQQDRIVITNKLQNPISFDYTPFQGKLNECAVNDFDYTPHLASILGYMLDQKMKIVPFPEIKIKKDPQEAGNFFGKTAYYDPDNKEVVLYVLGRHPKDVCRSFTHEMIHHIQNLEGRLGNIQTTNTNEDSHLQEIEKEAYLEGNMCFRNWEDSQKNG